MTIRGERSLFFLFICFAFICLLMSGGSRLIGMQSGEKADTQRTDSLMRAAFVSAPAPKAETGAEHQREQTVQRRTTAPVPESPILNTLTMCDANGNVLKGRTYMRAVYQAFVLGDGFV